MATPFLKWAGGKGKLADGLVRRTPAFTRYHEPFAGAAAVFFAFERTRTGLSANLNDANVELINSFVVLRDQPEALVAELEELRAAYLPLDEMERANVYYRMRDAVPGSDVHRAARLIFLNKTCYNGLYRVNRKGRFNVPHGRYESPTIANRSGLLEASSALRHVQLTADDFEVAASKALPGDFVYFDPPYQPLSATSNFTSYTSQDFSPHEQVRLANVFDGMTERGVAAMLSNSAHPFIEDLYQGKGYRIDRVPMGRAINSDATRRSAVSEFLIDNFDRPEVSQLRSSSPK